MLALTDLDASQDGTPRILDLRLAERLGFADRHKIRLLIERHRNALERFGEVSATVAETLSPLGGRPAVGRTVDLNKISATPVMENFRPLGGRPGRAYWLNRKQALYLCAKSETPRAAEVTIQMVEVFDQFLGLRDEAKTVKVREHWRRPPTSEPTETPSLVWFCNVAPATAVAAGWSRVEATVPTTAAYAMQRAALTALVTDNRPSIPL
jgi:hypothetical protein